MRFRLLFDADVRVSRYEYRLCRLSSQPAVLLPDAKGVWAANHAVRLLHPAVAWSEDEVLQRVVLPALGLANMSDAVSAHSSFFDCFATLISPGPADVECEEQQASSSTRQLG